jgi:hypothetical protein
MKQKKIHYQGGAKEISTGKKAFCWGEYFHSRELTDLILF